MSFSRAGQEVLDAAKSHAEDLGFQHCGSELLLCALCTVDGTVARRVLKKHGLGCDKVLLEVATLMGIVLPTEHQQTKISDEYASEGASVRAEPVPNLDKMKRLIPGLPVGDRRILYQYIGETLEGLATYVGKNQTELEDPSDLGSIYMPLNVAESASMSFRHRLLEISLDR